MSSQCLSVLLQLNSRSATASNNSKQEVIQIHLLRQYAAEQNNFLQIILMHPSKHTIDTNRPVHGFHSYCSCSQSCL